MNKLSTMLFQVVTVEQCCNNMLTMLFIVGRTTLFTPVDINLEQVVDFLNFFFNIDVGTLLQIAQQKPAKTMKKIFKKKIYFRPTDLPTYRPTDLPTYRPRHARYFFFGGFSPPPPPPPPNYTRKTHKLLQVCKQAVDKFCSHTAYPHLLYQVWNEVLTTCTKFDGIIRLVARLF